VKSQTTLESMPVAYMVSLKRKLWVNNVRGDAGYSAVTKTYRQWCLAVNTGGVYTFQRDAIHPACILILTRCNYGM